MESKARFALVGIFVSIFAFMGIAIVLWIAGVGASSKKFDIYVVKTDNSVGGLNRDSDVRYKGVKVGKVTSIKIDKNNPQFIKIYIEVEKDLPIKTDTKAKISSNGLTGISYVNLIGGSRRASMLKSVSKRQYPVIKTVPSTLEKLSVSAAKVMYSMNNLLKRLNTMLDKQSILYIRKTMRNLYKASISVKKIAGKLKITDNKLNKLLSNSNTLVTRIDTDGENFNNLLNNLKKLSNDTDSFINENRKNINIFTNSGLENLNSAFVELKNSSRELKNFIMELKQNPSIILRGKTIEKGPGE